MSPAPAGITFLPVAGIGEITEGDDLAGILAAAAPLLDGDIVVVTSKVVSKAEGRVVDLDRAAALGGETDRTLATRGQTSIVRTHHGLVLAAAGIDASNTAAGSVVLLPTDPDRSARQLRSRLATVHGRNVAVLVSDTAGRAWRNGQTDIAVGAAGIEVLHDYAGRTDDYGNELAVTAPAVADELAGAADLVKGKLDRCPAAVVRGLSALVLPRGEDGPGAVALVRDEAHDMFGLGAREAVVAALSPTAGTRRGFGQSAAASDLAQALSAVAGELADVTVAAATRVDVRLEAADERALGRLEARLTAAAVATGWRTDPSAASDPGARLSFVPWTT